MFLAEEQLLALLGEGGKRSVGVVTPNLRSRGREMSLPLFCNQETLLSGGTLTLQLTCAI